MEGGERLGGGCRHLRTRRMGEEPSNLNWPKDVWRYVGGKSAHARPLMIMFPAWGGSITMEIWNLYSAHAYSNPTFAGNEQTFLFFFGYFCVPMRWREWPYFYCKCRWGLFISTVLLSFNMYIGLIYSSNKIVWVAQALSWQQSMKMLCELAWCRSVIVNDLSLIFSPSH